MHVKQYVQKLTYKCSICKIKGILFILLNGDVYRAYSLDQSTVAKQTRFLARAWLAKVKGYSCHSKNQLLPKPFTEKNRVKVRNIPGHYDTKKKSVKITMHLGLDKLKFTTNFDRCAILNVLNCLTENFMPL